MFTVTGSPPYILVGNERYVRKIEITGDHRLSLVASNTSVFNTTGIGYHLRYIYTASTCMYSDVIFIESEQCFEQKTKAELYVPS